MTRYIILINRKIYAFDTKLDKKMEAGQIKFVLLDRIGAACISKDVDDDELMEAIRYICEE